MSLQQISSSDINATSYIAVAGVNTPTINSASTLSLQTNGTSTALTIDASQNVGIGYTTPQGKFEVNSGTSPSVAHFLIGYGGSNNYLDANANIFRDGSYNEIMRISGGNLGLGSASADVLSRGYTGRIFGITSAGATAIEINSATGSSAFMDLGVNGTRLATITSGSTGTTLGTTTALPLLFETNAAEAMRIDSNSNVGIGVVPAASGNKVLQVGAYSIYGSRGGGTDVLNNAYYNAGSSWIYLNNGAASLYEQSSGTHIWYTAPSGTATNSFGFSEAMRIDSSGNVGIGVGAPSSQLEVLNGIRISRSSTFTGYYQQSLTYTSSSDYGSLYQNLSLSTGNYVWQLAGTEKMRITSTGILRVNSQGNGSIYQLQQTITGSKTASGSGTSFHAFYCSETCALHLNVLAIQNGAPQNTAVWSGTLTGAYGNVATTVSRAATMGNLSGISVVYNNAGYYLDITITYTGVAPTVSWAAVGISDDVMSNA